MPVTTASRSCPFTGPLRWRAPGRTGGSIGSVLLLAVACASPGQTNREFDGDAAFRYLERQVAFGYRIPGTPAHTAAGDWIDSLVRQRADTVLVQTWVHVTSDGDSLAMRNILARFRPASPERILFLAHWDTRPVSDNPGWSGERTPVPGANDGASGVAVLLGMADALRARPPEVGVDLLFVDGEDYGDFQRHPNDVLIGSRYYANHLPPGPRPLYAVLFDLVADSGLRLLPEGQSLLGAPEVVDLVWRVAKEVGHGEVWVNAPGAGPTLTDDHVELQKVGIRAIDVVDFDYGPRNAWWHTPEDTLGKVSATSLQVVGDVGMALVRRQPASR
jgi:glutaminyl-peptide cyclotransferase